MGKLERAKQLLDELYTRVDNGGLNQCEQAMYDVLVWWLENGDEPDLD